MAITRTTGAFVGTSESTLATVGTGATTTPTEVDVLGDNVSTGVLTCYAVVTASAVGTVYVKVNPIRVTGQAYAQPSYAIAITTANGTVKVPIGKFSASRYMSAIVYNSLGSSVTVFVGYELEKLS